MKTILITGAFGYVGGRLSKYLAESGNYRLFLTSRTKRQKPVWLTNGEIVEFDLSSSNPFKGLNEKIDTVIHLASLNEVDCYQDPGLGVELNTLGSFRLIEQSKEHNIKRFVYLSTAHIYKTPLSGLISEKSVTRPVHPYAYSHRATEDYVLAAHDKEEFQGVVVRLSNSIGAPLDKEVNRWMLLVNDLCRNVVKNKKIVLKSSGNQLRNFIPLSDVCRGIKHLVELDESSLSNGVFNMGGNKTLSVLEMANLISKRSLHTLGYTPDLEIGKSTNEIVQESLDYSSEKLKSTNFFLTGSLEAEIDNLLIFCRDNMNRNE